MPPQFSFPKAAEYWIPAGQVVEFTDRENYELGVVARLRPGAGAADAEAEAEAMIRRLAAQYPRTKTQLGAVVTPLRELYVSGSLATGAAGAVALSRVLSGLLFGLSPRDGVTFVSVMLLLTGVALLACYVPARRATRVDPMVALRNE